MEQNLQVYVVALVEIILLWNASNLSNPCDIIFYQCGVYLLYLQCLWLKRLKSKFHNNRNMKDSQLPIVQQNSAKFGVKKAKKDSTVDDRCQMFGIANYQTTKPDSEEEASTLRHIKVMQDLYKSRKEIDMTKANSLMSLTLYARRSEIISFIFF
jgi:hypothetical protein